MRNSSFQKKDTFAKRCLWVVIICILILLSLFIIDYLDGLTKIIATALFAGFAGNMVFKGLFCVLEKIEPYKDKSEKFFKEFKVGKYASAIGIVERIMFVFIINTGYSGFPFLWIILKVGVQATKWKEDLSRDLFDAYLLLNLLSISLAFISIWIMLDYTTDWEEIEKFLIRNKEQS